MKKKYIVPESRLFSINVNESIAVASSGVAVVTGSATIYFTQQIDGCRGVYTGIPTAVVDPTITDFEGYYDQLHSYGADVYFNCFQYDFTV